MSQGIRPVNTAAKDILARLLASEDLTVRHDSNAETAYFDTQNRVLCLPVWQDMDNFMYDMLVGHEVAHALYTPADDWKEFVGDDSQSAIKQLCLNVCEDARIERKIKDKFPGLRRDFAKAYKTLHDQDIFEVKGKSVADLPLLDRINLYYKGEIYGQMTVPFSADERVWLDRLNAANSFDEIMDISRDLFEATCDDQDQQQQQPQQSETGQQGAGAGAGGSDSEKGESDDQSTGAGAGENGEEDGDQQGASSGGSENQDDSEDSGMSATDDTDDGDSAESSEGEQSTSGDDGCDLDYDDYSEGHAPGSTQKNYEKARSDLRDTESGEWNYYDVPKANLNKIIVSPDRIASLWDSYWSNHSSDRMESDQFCSNFLNRSKPIVNHMVQQFQQKQAADADKRSYTAKTGVLDPVSMINYRWSEDIFLKNEMHADGKSHGIVMFLDWSGSMGGILQDTVEQLLILVEFCRKAGIPYDVHAFSSNVFCDFTGDHWSDEARKAREEAAKDYENQFTTSDKTLRPHHFTLLNFLSSSQNAKQHSEAVRNLYYLSINSGYRCPNAFGLGSTPLNESILAAMEIVPKFQREHGVQIANTVFLTDGDGHGVVPYRSWRGANKTFISDPVTKKNYQVTTNDTSVLLNLLRDRTGSSTIGIRLHDSNSIKGLQYRYFVGDDWAACNKQFEEANKSYRKDHHFTCDLDGYDLHLVVKGNLKVETDPLDDLDDDASNTRIRNAFIKGGNRKKSSRVIANRLVDLIAVA